MTPTQTMHDFKGKSLKTTISLSILIFDSKTISGPIKWFHLSLVGTAFPWLPFFWGGGRWVELAIQIHQTHPLGRSSTVYRRLSNVRPWSQLAALQAVFLALIRVIIYNPSYPFIRVTSYNIVIKL